MGLLISLSFKTKGCTELRALCKELKMFFCSNLVRVSGLPFFSAVKHGKCVGVAAVLVPSRAGGLPTRSRKT